MLYIPKLLFLYLLFLYKKLFNCSFNIKAEDFKKQNFKIAIISSAGIGDALMTTPLITHIKKINPFIKIDVITYNRLVNIFYGNYFINNIILFNKKNFFKLSILFFKLKKNNYDIIFGAQPSNTLNDAFLSCSAKFNIKNDKINKSYFENKINKLYSAIIPDSFERHRVELNLDMLRYFNFNVETNQSHIYFKDSCISVDSILLKNLGIEYNKQDYICIHPGSGGDYKRWNISNFKELIDKIYPKYKIILIGGKEEINLSSYFKNNSCVYDLIGKLNLSESYNILKYSKLFICNDTGMMHLACAADANIIALFGPTNPNHIGPYSSKAIVIKKNNINDISVEDVLNVINKFI